MKPWQNCVPGKILEHITSQGKKKEQAGAQGLTQVISQISNVDPIAPIQVKFPAHVLQKVFQPTTNFRTLHTQRGKKGTKVPGIYAYEVYSKGCGGCGSSSTAIADDPDPC